MAKWFRYDISLMVRDDNINEEYAENMLDALVEEFGHTAGITRVVTHDCFEETD